VAAAGTLAPRAVEVPVGEPTHGAHELELVGRSG